MIEPHIKYWGCHHHAERQVARTMCLTMFPLPTGYILKPLFDLYFFASYAFGDEGAKEQFLEHWQCSVIELDIGGVMTEVVFTSAAWLLQCRDGVMAGELPESPEICRLLRGFGSNTWDGV